MPLEVIEATDTLAQMVVFRTSAVYEMLLSLQTLARGERHREWAAHAREALPGDFWAELEALYTPHSCGMLFPELAVDYPRHDDVPGFFEHVRNGRPTFVFYLLGRVLPLEAVRRVAMDWPALLAELQAHDPYYHKKMADLPLTEVIAGLPAFRARLVALWERYWTAFFRLEIPAIETHWEAGLADKQRVLARDGGQALIEYVTGKSDLPQPLPPDYPVREVVFTPLYLLPSPVYIFYGYGNVTVLYDSEATEARRAQIEHAMEEALATTKALSDATRLKILRLVAGAKGHALPGKKIAALLKLSPSAVSRHLAQLKDGGLILEEPGDGSNLNYRLQKETLTDLPRKLLDYLFS
jgi:DNA-binding transcriptional ArsR family regulator